MYSNQPSNASSQTDPRPDHERQQPVSVLAAPQGGVTLQVVNPDLTREEAETLLETLRVTLESNRPDPRSGKVESLRRWRAEQPRSAAGAISTSFHRRSTDQPEDTYADRLAVSLRLRDERCTGSKAVG